ncbi:TPA: DUF2815 family protein [Listeria monocytogenes]|uniref:DUF2815 family protein n=1 Tax=Listeria monocytogenes TaxID=1639 RepID=UPI000E72EC8E|nr:DUF2815 family protein [Listeria monocytogenes]EAE6190773.1 DUF2815 family protein [Listeria monocytogenes]EAK8992435.1 DUF2815 family protein [Listeria monocytogenes]EAK8995624.1 DUF2815 family protein [Listeria monocytogenes]EBF5351333.1 DUF2815 family protein [Listeria monocytogenes]EBF6148479.1 DUF2815 family protein [Listeria monocytogenes]
MVKVKTGKVRFSYVHVFEPWAGDESQEKKYSVCLIIDKTDKKTVKAIKSAIKELKGSKEAITVWGGKNGTAPKNLKIPLRDGDEERDEMEEFEGKYFVNANSKRQPGVINKKRKELTAEEFYSGCYGRASIDLYAYNSNGSKGIAVGLNNLLFLEDGEPLGFSALSAEDDFDDDLDDYEDDFDDDEEDDEDEDDL